MMMGFGYGIGIFGILGVLLNLLIIIGIVLLVVRLVKGSGIQGTSEKTAETILAERYARGEITEEEYRHMRDVLRH
ncbi:SHOCT domain-containing protein [Paenibacillus caui]|uniref:SHOCT domain-containing protein n=1 Tax=Paenibacillus caui TaxID=2873927 RepID=UPI001CA8C8AD|nr:SHOCT domain-containing protein [Paenibacillus caui]